MAVKKHVFTAIFIALLAISYLYLTREYNMKTVEYDFTGPVSKNNIEAVRKSVSNMVGSGSASKEIPFTINLIGRYNGSNLIMTTGLDYMTKNIPIIDGRFLVYGDISEAVLGDRAADKLFRSSRVTGESFELYGQRYEIVGIIKNSDDIYISFNENTGVDWNKKNIRFIIDDTKRQQLYIELLEGRLKALGLDASPPVIYKQEAYFYINILLAYALFVLLSLLRRQWSRQHSLWKRIYSDYRAQMRTIELMGYIIRNKGRIGLLLLETLKTGLFMLFIVICIALLQIPPGLIPGNLFSPTSYIDAARTNINCYIDRLESGIYGILLETHIINLLLIVYLGIAAALKKKSCRKIISETLVNEN